MLYDYDTRENGRKSGSGYVMLVILGIIVLLAIAGFAKYAHAADVRDQQGSLKDTPALIVVTAPTNWTGIWAAALAGYSMSNTKYELDAREAAKGDDPAGPWQNLASLDGIGGEGFDGTIQLGADVQLGRALIGFFGEYAFGGTTTEASVLGGVARLEIDQSDSYGLFARAGVIDGETLFYGAAGYVWTDVDVSLTGLKTRTFDFSGPAIEGGIEHRFKPGIRGRLSARYTFLEDERVAQWNEYCADYRLTAEPGIWSVKAGVVISTEAMFGNRGTGFFSGN